MTRPNLGSPLRMCCVFPTRGESNGITESNNRRGVWERYTCGPYVGQSSLRYFAGVPALQRPATDVSLDHQNSFPQSLLWTMAFLNGALVLSFIFHKTYSI